MNNHPASLVLVTGGSGFVGGHAVVAAVRAGYRVRTTVRSADRAAEVVAAAARQGIDAGPSVEFAVAELTADDGWAEAMTGVEHVLHIASPFPASDPKNADEVIAPARDGVLRVLAAAREAGVRRVVLTSSFAAVGYSPSPDQSYDETSWTDPADDNTAYVRSKAVAEQAAWDFVRTSGGPELTVLNPGGIMGPAISPKLSSSVGVIQAMLTGRMPAVPRLPFGMVDVRDLADLHVRAMTHPDAAGQRFLAVGDRTTTFFEIGRVLARHFPDRAGQVPAVELTDDQVRAAAPTAPALAGVVRQLGRDPVISTAKVKGVLGWSPRTAEETIVDTAQSLFDLGLVD